MLFPTLDFGVFFLAVFALSWALYRHAEGRKALLVAASYVFYGYWDWRFCFLLAASSLVNYAAGRLIGAAPTARQRKWILGIAVGLNLTSLGFFKYYGFFITSLDDLLHSLGLERDLPFLEIILPVGISFFTFQGISYVVDVHRGHIRASRSVLDVLLYISFFPQLVAGPIVRAATLLPQIERPADPGRILAGMGLLLILVGLFKKTVVANYLATEMVDMVFFDPGLYGPVDLLLGVYGYAIQIYCDFSAYSDIAIGVAALLGYRFDKNFDQPYRSESVRELWRRWHISLSTWLRDYLYIPLGGSRGGRLKTWRNMLITMVLGGVWHGAAWHFIVWGGLHGIALVAEQMVAGVRKATERPVWRRAIAVALTFNFTCLAYIFFRAESLDYAFAYLAAFGNLDAPVEFFTPFLVTLVALGFAAHFLPPDTLERVEAGFRRLPASAQGLAVGSGIVAIHAFGPDGMAPFIYFQF